jgi:hypothetical protein
MTGHSGHDTGTGQQAGQVGLVKPTCPGHPTWASMIMIEKRKKGELFFGNLIAILLSKLVIAIALSAE